MKIVLYECLHHELTLTCAENQNLFQCRVSMSRFKSLSGLTVFSSPSFCQNRRIEECVTRNIDQQVNQ
jgi:hypothetical protein